MKNVTDNTVTFHTFSLVLDVKYSKDESSPNNIILLTNQHNAYTFKILLS